MKKLIIVFVPCFVLLMLLVLVFSTTSAVQSKTTPKQSRKVSNTASSNQEQTKALYDKLGMSAPANFSSSRTGEQINWQVISGGATNGSSTNYGLVGTVGQTAVGQGSSTNFQLLQGYWQNFSSGCCDLAGDSNDDSSVDIADLTYTVNYMFKGGPAPVCLAEGDVNGDGSLDIADLTYRVNFMFKGGPALICGPA